MAFHQRRLPHWSRPDCPLFLTWCLDGSFPPNRAFNRAALTSGQAFATFDRLLDEARSGPMYMRQTGIAEVVTSTIEYGHTNLHWYDLHAYVVMANHVHLLASPKHAVPKIVGLLKAYSARKANQILKLTGKRFWQEEYYDRLVRNDREFERILMYIENNPVKAGLVATPEEYLWSSAGRGRLGSRPRPWKAAPQDAPDTTR